MNEGLKQEIKTGFLSQVMAVSVNLWREATRDRGLLVLVLSGFLLIFFSLVLGEMAVGGKERVLQTMGFWLLGMWGLISVIYLGSNILKQEIQRKTIYLILSRPVNRPMLLLGKFLGMLLVLVSIFILLAMAWMLLLFIMKIPLSANYVWALLFIFGEWVLIASLSLFFSSFTSPLLHNLFLVGITFLSHWSYDLKILADRIPESAWMKTVLLSIYHILPNLEALNFRTEAIYNLPIGANLLSQAGLVWLLWTATFLIGANLIFSCRKLI